MAALAATCARTLITLADTVAALSAECTRTPAALFDTDAVELRPHAGLLASAAAIRLLLEGSSL